MNRSMGDASRIAARGHDARAIVERIVAKGSLSVPRDTLVLRGRDPFVEVPARRARPETFIIGTPDP
ncbi:MAG TPA: hypothetical protein VFF73_23330 [Planctomycetota bacterium]|nr:hypothetical protein [Planctomycetota bacterium]